MKRSLATIFCIAALVTALTRLIPGDWCGELVQYRVAGELLASGQSPYRPELQFSRQVALREGEAARLVPYYNLPWLALACAPLSLVSLVSPSCCGASRDPWHSGSPSGWLLDRSRARSGRGRG